MLQKVKDGQSRKTTRGASKQWRDKDERDVCSEGMGNEWRVRNVGSRTVFKSILRWDRSRTNEEYGTDG